jgi:hypothetical protein
MRFCFEVFMGSDPSAEFQKSFLYVLENNWIYSATLPQFPVIVSIGGMTTTAFACVH